MRALEIFKSTGKTPSEHFENQKNDPKVLPTLFAIYLDWNKDDLKKRIEKRTIEMLKNGWVEEVKSVLNNFPTKKLHPMDSIGFREIISFINGDILFENLIETINIKTNQFAIKQVKWFKREKLDLILPMIENYQASKILDVIQKKIN